MKKNMIIGLSLCAVMMLGSTAALAAESEPMLISPAPTESETIIGTPQITVNGDVVDLSNSNLSQYIFEANGNIMVPLRAVAEKMGYTVSWDSENNAFIAEDNEWKVNACIDEDLYYGVTKIEGAVGMTAPQSYGTAPQLVGGRTFVPAKMFELMGYSFNSIGQFVDFTNRHTITDKDGNEYSNDILIISVAADAKESDILNIFKTNGLEVINKMDNLKMYTVKLDRAMNADEMDALIEKLEKNKCILAANKDYIVSLDGPAEIANPFVEYKSIDAAKKSLSFTALTPSHTPSGYNIDEITVLDNDLLQIIYKNGSDKTICYRTAVGNDDISGDYTVYANKKEIKVGDLNVNVRGNDGIAVAVWSNGNLTYSIQSDTELSEKEIIDIIQSL